MDILYKIRFTFLWIFLCLLSGSVVAATGVNETDKLTPSVRLPKTNYTGIIGQKVQIVCELLTSDIRQVLWRFTNTKGYVKTISITKPHWKYSGSTASNPSLTISNLDRSDQGTYRCMARNNAGTSISNGAAKLTTIEDFNECLSRPCLNGGSCVDNIGTYTCKCPGEYEGSNCEMRKLLHPNIKSHCLSNPCLNNGVCEEDGATYICQCTDQYEGTNCDKRKLRIPTKYALGLWNGDCSITLQTDTAIITKIKELSKLLYITLEFNNTTRLLKSLEKSKLYQPLKWTRTSRKYGRGLLQLHPHFEILSLRSLTFHTDTITIQLRDTPTGCVEMINSTYYQDVVRYILLKHLTRGDDEICNEHVINNGGYAKFEYECCYVNKENGITCYHVERSYWMKLIDVFTYIVIIILILYFPLMIPSTFYDRKYIPSVFEHSLDHPLYLNVRKTKGLWQPDITLYTTQSRPDEPFTMSKFERMKQFYPLLNDRDENKDFTIRVDKLDLIVRNDQIISDGNMTVSLWRYFYDAIFECGIRKMGDKKHCCEANVFGCLLPCGKEYPWYKCLRSFMRLIACIIVCLPWIIRVYVFVTYETHTHEDKRHAAQSKDLIDITSTLTPIHVVFILCYIVIIIDAFLLGNFNQKLKDLLRETMQSCLQYSHDPLRKNIVSSLISILTLPLRKFGIFGLFIGIVFWLPALPILILALSFRFFPTVSVVFCIIRFLAKDFQRIVGNRSYSPNEDENRLYGSNNKKQKKSVVVINIIFVIIVLLSVLSFIVLLIECTFFLIDVAVYIVIGLYVNASISVQILSIILIGYLYFNLFFGHISVLYNEYIKVIHKVLQMENKGQLDKVAILREANQPSKAFKVKYASKETASLKNHHGTPKWVTKGIILFLSKFDELYISKEFFLKACDLRHRYCPGKLSRHIFNACRRFFTSVMYLLFLAFIMLTFGDVNNITVSHQLLITIFVGMTPWILIKTNTFFDRPRERNLDELKDDYSFMSSLRELIESDEETWKMSDINVKENKIPNETNDFTQVKMLSS